MCIEIDINYQELDREELKRFLTDSTEDREWVKPKAAPFNPKGDGGYIRYALYDKARDRLKYIFDKGPFYIGGCSELRYKTFDIKQYGYDTCEVGTTSYHLCIIYHLIRWSAIRNAVFGACN